MVTSLTEKTFVTDEVRLAYAQGGGGAQPLVFLHGSISSRHSWDTIAEGFIDQFKVYLIDQRGHGESGRPITGYRAVDFARDGIAFLRGVVQEPAVLVGHSLGGMVATKVAADTPSMVRAAILEDPPLYLATRFDNSVFEDNFMRFRELTISGEPVQSVVTALIEAGFPEAGARYLGAGIAAVDPVVYEPIFSKEFWTGFDTDKLLVAIDCPILLAHDAGNPRAAVSVEDLRRAMQHIRHCTEIKFAGAGHSIHSAQRDEFTQAVNAFLAGI